AADRARGLRPRRVRQRRGPGRGLQEAPPPVRREALGEGRPAAPAERPGPNRKREAASGKGIKLAEILNPGQEQRWRQAKQVGVNHAIVGVNTVLGGMPRSEYLSALRRLKADYEAAGLVVAGVESHPVPAEKIKLGLPGRDEEIANYIAAIEA